MMDAFPGGGLGLSCGPHGARGQMFEKEVTRRLSLYQDVYSTGLIRLFFPDFSQDLPNGNAAGDFLLRRGPQRPAQPSATVQPPKAQALQFSFPFPSAGTVNSSTLSESKALAELVNRRV